MFYLAEYRKRPTGVADYLPWAGLVAPGVVLNKDGSFQRSARFRGPDLESATPNELVTASARLNNALRRLGSGWALFVEAQRRVAADYPASVFPDALSALIERERRAAFDATGAHFESFYFFTLLYVPPAENRARARSMIISSDQPRGIDWNEQLERFGTETDRFASLLEGVMPEIEWLTDEETLTYLHSSVSTKSHPVVKPEVSFYLDALLADEPWTGGLAPKLGNHHVRILTVRGFPSSTWPGLLDELNRLAFSYRWMTRFLFLDKRDAERELVKLRRQWFAKRKSMAALLRETIFQKEIPLVDPDADNKTADADAALAELGSDAVGFGFLTATLVVADPDLTQVEERRKAIERIIGGRGFVTIHETFNATESWLSSIPGHVYANVRQPIVSTLNLAHLLPLSAVWAGPVRNAHLNAPPLMTTKTDGSTPFRLSTHVGDVGHTLIVGPIGAGKSTFLAIFIVQVRRYPKAKIFCFDKGGSVRATILGLGGAYYDLGAEQRIAFQPLAAIDGESTRAWAAEWVLGLLAHERIEITPEVKGSVWSALASLSTVPVRERTLTGLSVLLQSTVLRQALEPYTLSGPYGRLLDADEDHLGTGPIQAFEMESLMHGRAAVLPILTYLFHRLEGQFDGSPTWLILDEAWVFLDDPLFATRIREWLKTLRKKNVSVVFATQSLADIQRSSIAPALIESCPSRIFLPSPQAIEPQLQGVYESFGLNDRQIELIARAQPKRDYYYHSRLGARWFDLSLNPVALAFAGASRPEDQRAIDAVLKDFGPGSFAAKWLEHKRLAWAGALITDFKPMEGSS
jgi:type IV secretion/conjugal transfer VirB4 family ATPase